MAVALEEIAAGVVDSAVGPSALAVGAGAVAVAFAARSARCRDARGRFVPRSPNGTARA